MDEFVSRVEYDERMKRIEDEDRRQNHRIDKLETITDQIADMAASIKAMVVTMQGMQKEQEEQGKIYFNTIREKTAGTAIATGANILSRFSFTVS